MIRLFFSIFLVAFLSISCHAQTANDSLKDSISQINRLWPAEKVYLHTDKPYYDVGDTIWLKAYVLDAGLLTATKKSNYLYVELYNDTSEVVRRISIRLNFGLGHAQIPLPDKIFRQGGYTLRAYTNWMQNFGSDAFFERRLYLGKPMAPVSAENAGKSKRDLSHMAYRQKLILAAASKGKPVIDLQFLPEGGQLIAGLPSLLAFKAIGLDGKGRDVTGQIKDSKGVAVAEFKSSHLGMGSVEFSPVAGQNYTAVLTKPDSVSILYKLPPVAAEGISLRVSDIAHQDSLKISILGTANDLSLAEGLTLVASVRGQVYYAETIKTENFLIAKKLFPSGVVRLSLFKGFQVLSNRSVFIDYQDRFQVTFTTDKPSYGKRDSILMTGVVKDKDGNPVTARLSLSVTDDGLVQDDKTGDLDIGTEILLRSELKGKVESPGYYLNPSNIDRWQKADLLMLTQGWIGLSESILSPPKETKYWEEKELVLKGWVGNVLNKPVKGAPVLISSQKPALIKNTITNDLGEFQFSKLPTIDSGSFFIQARTPSGKEKSFGSVNLRKFTPAIPPEHILDPVVPWFEKVDTSRLAHFKKINAKKEEKLNPTGIMLNEVNIKTKKIIKNSYNRNGPGNADYVFTEKEIKESAVLDLYELLQQKLPGIKVIYKDAAASLLYNGYYVLIKIDGGPLPMQLDLEPPPEDVINEMKDFKIASFKGMEVMYSRKYTHLYGGGALRIKQFSSGQRLEKMAEKAANEINPQFNESTNDPAPTNYLEMIVGRQVEKDRDFDLAVIEITTGNGRGWFKNTRADFVSYRPVPIALPLKFYEPKYTTIDPSGENDTRSTIYWKPNITTDGSGNFSLRFFNSDVSRNLSVTLQGVDLKGGLVSGKLSIKTRE